MKILMLVQLPPPVHGAAVVNAKARGAIGKQYSGSKVLNLSNAESIDDCDKLSGRKVFLILQLYIRIFISCFKGFDLVYFSFCPNGLAFYRDVIISLLLQVFGIKHVFHLHGRGVSKGQGGLKDFLAKLAFRKAYVIHLAPCFWGEVSHLIPKERFFVVPNSADDIGGRENSKESGPLNVLYLSNYVRGKGPMYVLKIAELLWDKGVDVRFRLAGAWFDKTLESEISEWKNNNKHLVESGFVDIGGAVAGEEKHHLFNESDVFLFPSYIDTFPLAVIEAMSSGKVVVASDTGAVPDILGETGLVCSEHDWSGMAQQIIRLEQDRTLLKVYGDTARKRYEDNYTDRAFDKALSKVIENVITDK